MSKIVCYTCICGSYDKLKDPLVISENVDYICFTDQNFSSNIWKFKPIPEELQYLPQVKRQRVIKICPHKYLSEYDISIWVDGNIQIIGDLNECLLQYDLNKTPFYSRKHPDRNCIYDEARVCINSRKDTKENIQPQIDRYKAENYPEKNGLIESGIMIRKHNDLKCKLLCDRWITEVLNNSKRDQLSFNYACWKNNFEYGIMENENNIINTSKIFKLRSEHGK